MTDQAVGLSFRGPDGPVQLLSPPLLESAEPHPANLSYIAPAGDQFYGYHQADMNPFSHANSINAAGGYTLFDKPSKANFLALLKLLRIDPTQSRRQYMVFHQVSASPLRDGYLEQIRIVDRFGLKYLYRALSDEGYEHFSDQPISISELMWTFLYDQAKKWQNSPKLAGTFGGDGYWAYESLCFGLMVENSYNNVYRLWSRAWLVTK